MNDADCLSASGTTPHNANGQNSAVFPQILRPFKGIVCGDISEFESYHPSHAVRSPPDRIQDSRTMCELLHTGSGRFTSIVAGSLSDR
jgi:hypothetical protein